MAAGIDVQLDEHLAQLDAAADQLADDALWQLDDDQVLQRIDGLGQELSRLTGLRMQAIHEAHRRKICEDQQGWTLPNHLVAAQPQQLRSARATVALADDLARFTRVQEALIAGRITPQQAGAITASLKNLPMTTSDGDLDAAQAVMIDHAAQFDPAALRRIGNHLAEIVAPDAVEDKLGQQLARQEARARRDRYLEFRYTGDGSISIRGQLPVVAGEAFMSQVDGYAHQCRNKGLDRAIDPEAEFITTAQSRADGLVALSEDLASRRLPPTVAGDRPRAVITLQYNDLIAGIRGATLVGSGEPVAAGTARRIACSGEVIPVVLGGPSVVLDVGRQNRLFSGMLRAALVQRDGGCVFPGCDAPPSRCEGHHIRPWWAGGRTALDNGVLVCAHHHDLVEPDARATPGCRWEIRLDRTGLPEVLPPMRVDPHRRPRQHARFTERTLRRRR
jgi:hypothetical protein